MTSILQANNLVRKFGDLTAVDDVSFDIQEGEIFSLLGPNGDKQTTISLLYRRGLLLPSLLNVTSAADGLTLSVQ
jgi:ABC-2 type transport system ATP-binding protein